MLSIAVYKCQFCDAEFNYPKDCINHELEEHIGLSKKEYKYWIKLIDSKNVLTNLAAKMMYKEYINNADIAEKRLNAFTESHHLDGISIKDLKTHEFYIDRSVFKEHKFGEERYKNDNL